MGLPVPAAPGIAEVLAVFAKRIGCRWPGRMSSGPVFFYLFYAAAFGLILVADLLRLRGELLQVIKGKVVVDTKKQQSVTFNVPKSKALSTFFYVTDESMPMDGLEE